MNYHQATALGETILASGQADLIAIGRFVPIEELTGCESWGCSLRLHVSRLNPDPKPKRVWSHAEWLALLQEPAAVPPKKAPQAVAQPSLF